MQMLTERLVLRPFTIELIDAAIEGDYSKINSLGFDSTCEWPEAELLDALPFFKSLLLENGLDGFNSWIILNKETFEIMGSLGFIGRPDDDGNVEIGFGVIPGKRNNGYCYESVMSLINWAFENSRVNCILAKCDNSNVQSKSILKKIGFNITGNEENLIIWELQK